MFLVVLAREVECLCDIGAGKCFKECLADLRRGERRRRCEIVCDRKTVVVLGQFGEGQRVENLVREGRDERRLGKELDCSLSHHILVSLRVSLGCHRNLLGSRVDPCAKDLQ